MDLLQGPWSFRFPLGSVGCIDARAALSGKIRYSEVEKKRSGSPIVDLGHVDPARLASCRADFAVISHYDRYAAERETFGPEMRRYDALLVGGRERAVLRPVPRESSGPVVRIVELKR